MKTRRIGPLEVSCIGLGCMSFSHAYGTPPPPEQAERVLLEALERGVTLIDTAALYGFGGNELLVGRVLKPHRSRIVLASKGGLGGVQFPDGMKRVIDGRPETLRRHCEESLQRLGTDVIDLYYLHRWDKQVPIEDSMGALADLVRAGKVRALGLSEVSAATLRKAHAVHPIAAVQSEYSLWSRVVEIGVLQACRDIGASLVAFSPVARGYLTGRLRDVEEEILPTCRELGIGFVPYSPLGRGFLTGRFTKFEDLPEDDFRRRQPRFQGENFQKNLDLVRHVERVAEKKGCTPAQLVLAWLLHQGDDIVPIPGTTRVENLEDNVGALGVTLTQADLERIDKVFPKGVAAGERYLEGGMATVNR